MRSQALLGTSLYQASRTTWLWDRILNINNCKISVHLIFLFLWTLVFAGGLWVASLLLYCNPLLNQKCFFTRMVSPRNRGLFDVRFTPGFDYPHLNVLHSQEFVAVPLGYNLTVEGQLKGYDVCWFEIFRSFSFLRYLSQVEGGVQFDAFPLNLTTVKFEDGLGGDLSLYKTPRQLRLTPGELIIMQDNKE